MEKKIYFVVYGPNQLESGEELKTQHCLNTQKNETGLSSSS